MQQDTAPRTSLRYLAGLDGLRGAAVAAVVVYHLSTTSDLGWFDSVASGGYLGVSAFFTLSGYLITAVLLTGYDARGSISFSTFWSRRLRRLMPAAVLTIAAVMLLTPLVGSPSQLSALPGDALSSLAYVFNWHQIINGNEYAATFTQPSPLNHFWSLAVEEQAYVVIPLFVAAALRLGKRTTDGRRPLAVLFIAIIVASFAAGLLSTPDGFTNRAYLGTDTRIAEIAVGALLATATVGRPWRNVGWLTWTSALCTVGVLVSWVLVPLESPWLFRGGLIVHAAAVAVIIAAIAHQRYAFPSVLQARPLVHLGRISYGVYLFHWPVMIWLTASKLSMSPWAAAVLQVIVTLALAHASFYLLEQPIRHGTRIHGASRTLVPVGSVAVLVAASFALPTPDDTEVIALEAVGAPVIATTTLQAPTTAPPTTAAVDPAVSDSAPALETSAPTTVAPPPPPIRVLITGDSFGLSLGVGFERMAQRGDPVSAYNRGLVACGFGRGGKNRGIGKIDVWPSWCKTRSEMMVEDQTLFTPDIVLASGGLWDITDRKLERDSQWRHVGDPLYDAYLVNELRFRTDEFAAHGARVVWTTIPNFDPVYARENIMGPPPYAEAEPGRADRFNELLYEAMTQRPDAIIIDLAGWMRAHPGGEFDPTLRTDGVHFLESSAVEAAQWLLPQLEELR